MANHLLSDLNRPSVAEPAMVELADVWLRHREQNLALQDVRFRVERGEFVFVVGQCFITAIEK